MDLLETTANTIHVMEYHPMKVQYVQAEDNVLTQMFANVTLVTVDSSVKKLLAIPKQLQIQPYVPAMVTVLLLINVHASQVSKERSVIRLFKVLFFVSVRPSLMQMYVALEEFATTPIPVSVL